MQSFKIYFSSFAIVSFLLFSCEELPEGKQFDDDWFPEAKEYKNNQESTDEGQTEVTQSEKIASNENVIIQELLKSTVTVVTYGENGESMAFGSGVFVSSNVIATNYHVVEGGYSFEIIRNADNQKTTATSILKLDELHDVALLKLEMDNPSSIKIASKLPEIGSEIIVAGSPEGLDGTVSKGIVSAIRRSDPYDFDVIQMSAPISHGSSGGPVINEHGELVGISVATFANGQNLNFAVPAKYVSFLLQGK